MSEVETTESVPAPATAEPAERTLGSRLRLPLMIGGPLIVLIIVAFVYVTGGRYQSTDDAYVRAAQVTVSSNVAGRVSEIDVRDNQQVRKGDILFRLDDRPFRIAVDEAQAQLANARLQVESLEATYRQRQADQRAAQTNVDYQSREYERQKGLLAPGISSKALVDKVKVARDAARQQLEASHEQITSVLASLGGHADLPVDQHPGVQQAQAQLDRARLNLSYTVITAPAAGVVTKVEQLQVGNYINASTPTFALVSTQDIWVEANFKEVQLTNMRVGQEASIEIDAYPGRKLKAKVVSVSPGTGTEFSMLPAENASGNWVKVVQRLPVRLEVEDLNGVALRSGLSADVEVDTRHRRTLFGLRSDTIDDVLTAATK